MLMPGEKEWGRLYFANEIMQVFFGENAGRPEAAPEDSASDATPEAAMPDDVSSSERGRPPARLFDAPPE
jgi:hypothetical protein